MDNIKPSQKFANYKNSYFNTSKSSAVSEYLNIKQVPQAPDLEEAVLGAILLEGSSALGEIADRLKPDDFHIEKHQLIYSAAIQLFALSEPIDVKTIVYKLRKNGDFEKAGGVAYITKLTNKIISSANIQAHAYVIKELSLKRQLIKYSGAINDLAYDSTVDIEDLLERAENKLFQIAEKRTPIDSFEDIIDQSIQEIGSKRDGKGFIGVPTGFSDLDAITLGWQKSDLIIIAARPSMGKTAFILSAVRNAVVNYGKKAAIFSLEMSALQMVNRLLSAEASISATKIRRGELTQDEWSALHRKADLLRIQSMFINDNPSLNIFELRSECRRLKQKHDIDFIVIDYLQLMQSYSTVKHFNREQEISYISRSLKALAKELDIPVIALSQLSRAVESRQDKRPIISDLRESGSIEQDADLVLLLFRPEYYGIAEISYNEGNTVFTSESKGVAEVIVAKHRNGAVGSAMLSFLSEYVKFDNKNALVGLQSGANNSSDNKEVRQLKKAETISEANSHPDDSNMPF